MEGSYLLEIIQRLNKEELIAFERFSQAQAPGLPGERVLALIHFLQNAAPNYAKSSIQKVFAYAVVFEGEPYREGRLEKVMVEVTKLLKAFLLQLHYFDKTNETGRQVDWAIVLKERGLPILSGQALTKAKKQMPIALDRDQYHQLFKVELEIFGRATANNHLKGDLNVPQTLKALDLYYHIARLELLNHYLLQLRVTKLGLPHPENFPWFKVDIPPAYLEDAPVLKIAHKITELLLQDLPPLTDFQTLSTLLKTHEATVAPSLLHQFYTYLRNFCAFHIIAGADHLLPLYHQLQRDNLERGYLYHEGSRISASAFISLTTAALRVGDIEWANHFIQSHKGRVIGENSSFDLYRLNWAQYLFALGKWEEALDNIAPVFDFLNYTLSAKRLEIKILYELKSELLPYKASAFKIFITRASQKFMPSERRLPNADFINLIHQILRSKPGQKGRSARLMRHIQAKPRTAERDWLIEKVAQLR